jgi:hypothetical protein
MYINRIRQTIHVTHVVVRGKTILRVETNVTGYIEVDADLRNTGGRAIGRNAGTKFKVQTVGRRRFIIECRDRYV